MTIPRKDDDGAEPSTKKTVDPDRFHKLFLAFRSWRERDVQLLSNDKYDDQRD